MHYYAILDRNGADLDGSDEAFQVTSIEDDDGNEYTESLGIDLRHFFRSLEELAAEIERLTGEPAEIDEL